MEQSRHLAHASGREVVAETKSLSEEPEHQHSELEGGHKHRNHVCSCHIAGHSISWPVRVHFIQHFRYCIVGLVCDHEMGTVLNGTLAMRDSETTTWTTVQYLGLKWFRCSRQPGWIPSELL